MNVASFAQYVASGCPAIWVDSTDYEFVETKLRNEIIAKRGVIPREILVWDQHLGLRNSKMRNQIEKSDDGDVIHPITYLSRSDVRNTVLFAFDYRLFLREDYTWRLLLNNLGGFRNRGNTLVIVSPYSEVPQDVKDYITLFELKRPLVQDFKEQLYQFCKANPEIPTPSEELTTQLCKSGSGMQSHEFENAIALSWTMRGALDPQVVYEQKEQMVRRNGCLRVIESTVGYESICGLGKLKPFAKKMVVSGGRGVLLVGVSGCGKTHFATALGRETNRVTVALDFAALMGSLVGQTERATKAAFEVIDAMSPAIAFIDEIDKGLAGVTGYAGDSGVSQRQGGEFLKWMSMRTSDTYVVATCNDISKLPPEYLQADRWDAIFFVDLPNDSERDAIFRLYAQIYGINPDQDIPDMINWSGAEIKSLCRLSHSLECSLMDAREYVVPLYDTMHERITMLRDWAKGRTVPASIKDNVTHMRVLR